MTTAATLSRQGLRFHPLRVADVTPLTDDSIAVSFEIPSGLDETFRYLPGQHVTLRRIIDGEDTRRSYSICASANSGLLRVGIKRLAGGRFSNWANDRLTAGDVIDVMPPVGEFTIEPDETAARGYAAIAAGSGITPVLSLVATTLESEPASRWTVVLGNRTAGSIMFLEELEELKDRFPDRFQLIHVLSREDIGLPLFNGRIDRVKLERMFEALFDPDEIDGWFLCGPFELVQDTHRLLEERGIDPGRIHDELFFAGPPDPSAFAPPPEDEAGTVTLRFTLDGRESVVRMRPESRILDAALTLRPELPFSCKGGMCASCKARLTSGEVEMDKNWALVDEDLERGFILTCQSHPTTGTVAVDYDQR